MINTSLRTHWQATDLNVAGRPHCLDELKVVVSAGQDLHEDIVTSAYH